MENSYLTRLVFFGGLASALIVSPRPADAQAPTPLRYGFEAGRHYAYEVKIEADLDDSVETREGVLTYNILSAEDQKVVYKVSGVLATHSKPKANQARVPFGPGFIPRPPMGPPPFAFGGSQAVTMNRQGKVLQSEELTSLPFLLGHRETLVIDEFPADGRRAWDQERDILVVERKASGPFGHMRFGPFRSETDGTRRTAKERTDYSILESGGDLVRVSKKFHLYTEEQAGQAPRFNMSGEGEFAFNVKEGVNQSTAMKYQIQINEPNSQVRVPVTLSYRLLSAEEVAAVNKRNEEARAAAAEANAPKPLTAEERRQLLRDLRSRDERRVQNAANRLAKATVDDNPAVVAKALAPLLRHPSQWVQGAAAQALEVWATPEVEAALIAAAKSENFWVRARAINALGKVPSEAAAEAVAAQMYRNRGEASKALKAMGPVAEAAAITCLKDRDQGVRSEACQVLGEIGGEESLKPLKDLAAGAQFFELQNAKNALAAIQRRLASGERPKAPASRPAAKARAPIAASGKEQFRTWHGASGTFAVEAAFQGYEDRKVTLKKKDGTVIRVPIEKLSTEDHVYILEHSQSSKPARNVIE